MRIAESAETSGKDGDPFSVHVCLVCRGRVAIGLSPERGAFDRRHGGRSVCLLMAHVCQVYIPGMLSKAGIKAREWWGKYE